MLGSAENCPNGGLIMLLFAALAKDITQFSGVGWGIKLSDNLLFHNCSSGVFASLKKENGQATENRKLRM